MEKKSQGLYGAASPEVMKIAESITGDFTEHLTLIIGSTFLFYEYEDFK